MGWKLVENLKKFVGDKIEQCIIFLCFFFNSKKRHFFNNKFKVLFKSAIITFIIDLQYYVRKTEVVLAVKPPVKGGRGAGYCVNIFDRFKIIN
jgi:hypothetical protein